MPSHRTWVPEVQCVPLKYVGETDVGVYRIHIEGDSLKTVAEDVVQTPVEVEVYRQTLEDTESGSRLQSPVEGAQFLVEVVGGIFAVGEFPLGTRGISLAQIAVINTPLEILLHQEGNVWTEVEAPAGIEAVGSHHRYCEELRHIAGMHLARPAARHLITLVYDCHAIVLDRGIRLHTLCSRRKPNAIPHVLFCSRRF